MKDRKGRENTTADDQGARGAGTPGFDANESGSPAISDAKSSLTSPEATNTLELVEERVSLTKTRCKAGEVVVRKVVDELPSDVEIEKRVERAQVEHVPIGRQVERRVAPWQDGNTLVIPVYEEEVVVTKRLILREEIRIRREEEAHRRVVRETVRRERAVVERERPSAAEPAPRQD